MDSIYPIITHVNNNDTKPKSKKENISDLYQDPVGSLFDDSAKITVSKEFGLIVIGALIITASFLWKDFFTLLGETYFPGASGVFGRLVYVILITCFLILIAISLRKFLVKEAEEAEEKTYDELVSIFQDD